MSFSGSNLTQLRDERSWDPRTGWTILRPWRGSPAAIDIKINALKAAGIRFDHQASATGDYEIVTAYLGAEDTQPPDEPLSDIWALDANDIEADIWYHPRVQLIFAGIMDVDGFPTQTFSAVKTDILDLVAGQKQLTIDDVPWWFTGSHIPGILYPDIQFFVGSLLKGKLTYSYSQFVLRNSKTVSSNYTVAPDYARVDRMIPAADMPTLYPLPVTVLFSLPAGGFWLERTPTLEPVAADKFEIKREWWRVEDYDPFFYKLYTDP